MVSFGGGSHGHDSLANEACKHSSLSLSPRQEEYRKLSVLREGPDTSLDVWFHRYSSVRERANFDFERDRYNYLLELKAAMDAASGQKSA